MTTRTSHLRAVPSATRATGRKKTVRRVAEPANQRVANLVRVLGAAFVPVATYVIAHTLGTWEDPLSILVLGGLLYSATSVYQWARSAFGHWYKALGFAVLLEGVMTFAPVPWLSAVALVYLVVINAIAVTGKK